VSDTILLIVLLQVASECTYIHARAVETFRLSALIKMLLLVYISTSSCHLIVIIIKNLVNNSDEQGHNNTCFL
jgi:hypothetical protein